MAIFQKVYETYKGGYTSINHRTLVICRYGLEEAFKVKWFLPFFVLCFIPPLIIMCIIYLRYNLHVIDTLQIPIERLVSIDTVFFIRWLQIPQLSIVLLMVMIVGPAVLSPDMRNNALPLYFSRPISKAHYLLGKFFVLLALCSVVTWVPGLLLVLFQTYLSEDGWLANNWGSFVGAFFVPVLWTVCLSMLSFAITALIKVKLTARLTFFGLFFVGFAFSNVMFVLFHSWTGGLFNLFIPMDTITKWLYRGDLYSLRYDMPLVASLATIVTITAISTYIVYRKIRAYEVVS